MFDEDEGVVLTATRTRSCMARVQVSLKSPLVIKLMNFPTNRGITSCPMLLPTIARAPAVNIPNSCFRYFNRRLVDAALAFLLSSGDYFFSSSPCVSGTAVVRGLSLSVISSRMV